MKLKPPDAGSAIGEQLHFVDVQVIDHHVWLVIRIGSHPVIQEAHYRGALVGM